jgi:hypothetical protein
VLLVGLSLYRQRCEDQQFLTQCLYTYECGVDEWVECSVDPSLLGLTRLGLTRLGLTSGIRNYALDDSLGS